MTSNAFLLLVMELQASQHRLAEALQAAADVETGELAEHLLELRPHVVQHFNLKDSFYDALLATSQQRRDNEALRYAMGTSAQMKAQSARVRRFFGDLEAMGPQVTATLFRSLASTIQRRFDSERQAAFPHALRAATHPVHP